VEGWSQDQYSALSSQQRLSLSDAADVVLSKYA